MADTLKVEMLRPVGGFAVGSTRDMPRADAERLAARGCVKIKSEGAAPQNKMERAPENKAGAKSTRAKGAAKRRGK